MNPPLEIEKLNISLSLANQCVGALVNDLATTRIRIRELEAQIAALMPKPPAPNP